MVFILIACRWRKEGNNVGVHSYVLLIMIANEKCSPSTFGKQYQNDYIATGATGCGSSQ